MRAAFLPLIVLLATLWVDGCTCHRPPGGPTSYAQTVPGTDIILDMVWVPDGGIWLGRHEVTWAEYEAYYFSKDIEDGAQAVARPSPAYLPHDKGWGRGRMPAMGISRHAAAKYCEWLSLKTGFPYRLPKEAEWQAGLGALKDIDAEAWHAGNSEGRTHEVGSKAANKLGLHDMRGNVWEYCLETFEAYDERPLMRGGSWADDASDCAEAPRAPCPEAWNDSDPQRPRGIWWLPDGPYVGFRVARSPWRGRP